MMIVKTLCRILIMLSLFFLISCEAEGIYLKEKHGSTKSTKTIKKLTGKEARETYNILKRKFSNKLSLSNFQMRTSSSLPEIDYNTILFVIDSLGVKNYTFKIVNHPDDNYKTFHNLVLTDNHDEPKATIMKYEMTEAFAEEYNAGVKTFNEFKGKIKAISPIADPCDPIEINYPIEPIDPIVANPSGGGGALGPTPGSPTGGNTGGSGGTGSTCESVATTFECSCGDSYSSLSSYFNSRCGDGSYPGYTLTIVFTYYYYICRIGFNPCSPDGSIGVIEPELDCNTSKEDLKLAFPSLSDQNAELLANTINNYGNQFGIDSNYKLCHFLSQIAHETGGLDNLNVTESLNYSASRLLTVFSKYFSYSDPLKANPDNYAGDQEKIGNLVYSQRMGNGSEASGDGYKYRGRGLIQLTGKLNYQNFQNFYNSNFSESINLIENPDSLTNNSELAIISAMWYYKNKVVNKTLLKHNLNEPVRVITKKVNGGLNGLLDRVNKYNDCEINIDCITN